MPSVAAEPNVLKPYLAHGVALEYGKGGDNALGECPWCGAEGKFSVRLSDGRWRCFKCNEGNPGENGAGSFNGGNALTFLRLLWERSRANTTDEEYKELAVSRKLLSPFTLKVWGVAKSMLTGEWLVPGYNHDGKLCNLYRYVRFMDDKKPDGYTYKLLLTPGMYGEKKLTHQMYGVPLWNPKAKLVYICEGPWDGMALWEVLRRSKREGTGKHKSNGKLPKLVPCKDPEESLAATCNVLAVPGCNVFYERWVSMLRGTKVALLFDNDHPTKNKKTGQVLPPAAHSGLKRVVGLMATHEEKPKEVHYLHWGDKGYTRDLPHGFDVRDALTVEAPDVPKARYLRLDGLLNKLQPIPSEWVQGKGTSSKAGSLAMDLKPCKDWATLVQAWRKALKWVEGLDRALSVMIATAMSTKVPGEQLWFKIIGPPGTGKSTLCEAISTCIEYVYAKSSIRGFHSGYDSGGKDKEEDNSLLAEARDKCLVTKDGDTLLKAPNLPQILSEARDIYDRTSRTHYRNKKSKNYKDIDLTWLLCGTPSLREIDTSELGARFLDCVIMMKVEREVERSIIKQVGHKQRRMMRRPDAENSKEPKHYDKYMLEAMQLTGGYVKHLCTNPLDRLYDVVFDDREGDHCELLGLFISYMRTKPPKKGEGKTERELSSRLVGQINKLAQCLATVLNRKKVDDEVMRRVVKVAMDTSRGDVFDITQQLFEAGPVGLESMAISQYTNHTPAETAKLLRFMKHIDVVENYIKKIAGVRRKPRWRLTKYIADLYMQVVPDAVESEAYALWQGVHEETEE